MTIIGCVFPLLLILGPAPQEVESTADKKGDFGAFRTSAWERGCEACDPAMHKVIVAAIDAEMAGLGITKGQAENADVAIKYHPVRASNMPVDVLETRQKDGQADPRRPSSES